jgi:hypothetical protein
MKMYLQYRCKFRSGGVTAGSRGLTDERIDPSMLDQQVKLHRP